MNDQRVPGLPDAGQHRRPRGRLRDGRRVRRARQLVRQRSRDADRGDERKADLSNRSCTVYNAVFAYGAFITQAIAFVATAAAVFFFIVKPVGALRARFVRPEDEPIPDEERRHQELLAALRARA